MQAAGFFFQTSPATAATVSRTWTTRLAIDAPTGNIGIGTSSPSSQLHVNNASGAGTIRVSGAGLGVVNFKDLNAGVNQKIFQWRSEGGPFRMASLNDAEDNFALQNILVANSSGNIGIGTATPTSKLHVVGGSITVQGSTAGGGSGNGDMAVRTMSGNGYWDMAAINTNGTFVLYDALNMKLPLTVEPNTPTNTIYVKSTGSVGIGTSTPGASYKLDVNGQAHVSGDMTVDGNISAKYQDVAEWVPSTQKLTAGTVVVLDSEKTNHVLASTKAYDTAVAGVISDTPGVILGQGGDDKLKVATTGRVKVKVDATRAPIKVGDLLVTSEVEGVAMKSVPVDLGGTPMHRPGTIIGKALEPLASGTGEILVLLSLQ